MMSKQLYQVLRKVCSDRRVRVGDVGDEVYLLSERYEAIVVGRGRILEEKLEVSIVLIVLSTTHNISQVRHVLEGKWHMECSNARKRT